MLRALAYSEEFRGQVNRAIRVLVGRADATSAADVGTTNDDIALPMAVHRKMVLDSHKIVNQCCHDKSKEAAARIGAAAYELALLLHREAENVGRDSQRSIVTHTPEWYLDLMLDSTALGPTTSTCILPAAVRAVLAPAMLRRIGARAGGRTEPEISEVRGRVSA